eukprot:787484-Prymnesium_polylepis.1
MVAPMNVDLNGAATPGIALRELKKRKRGASGEAERRRRAEWEATMTSEWLVRPAGQGDRHRCACAAVRAIAPLLLS